MAEASVALSEEQRALARAFGREMAHARRTMLAYYLDSLKLTPQEAEARAGGDDSGRVIEQRIHGDPRQVLWWDLDWLAERDPEAAGLVWERIADQARDDLATGNRAAAALEFDGSPWERAQFLALREALRREWQPRGGVEDSLIDTMAQAFQMQETWLAQLRFQSTIEGKRQRGLAQREGKREPPTLSTAEALEQSAAMAERFNRIFLRTLRALRDLRRVSVVVGSVGQMNLAERQVNVGQVADPDPAG